MSLRSQVAAAGLSAVLLVAPALTFTTPANAATVSPIAAECAAPQWVDRDAVDQAAQWIIAQWEDDQDSLSGTMLADAIIGLVAAQADHAVIEEMLTKLETQVPAAAAAGVGQQGKFVLAIAATGNDPRTFGGHDLVAAIQSSLEQKPDAGGIWNVGYALGALAAVDAEVPTAAIVSALEKQTDNGGFGWGAPGQITEDPDMTGSTLVAFSAVAKDDADAAALLATPIADGLQWGRETMVADTYWVTYSPANSTAMMGMAFNAEGIALPKTVEFMLEQQALTQAGAWGNVLDDTEPDMLATIQVLPFIAGTDFTEARLCTPASEPTTEPTATPTSTPTAEPTTTPTPLPQSTTSAAQASPTRPGLPRTGL